MAVRKITKGELKRKVGRRATVRGVRGPAVDGHLPPYTGEYANVQQQVYLEYNYCWNYMRPKIQKWLERLKLYNNQRRDADKVGEPLIYETHRTTMAILTGDPLEVEFEGRIEGEEDQADNLNILAENDRDEMRKNELDYEWNWDALFFGFGLVLMNDFDTDSKTPIPTVIDPTTFIHNPGAKWVNGNRAGEGAMLYGGYEVKLTKAMMKANPRTEENPNGYFNLDSLIRSNDLYSLSGESSRLRREAQGMNDLYTFESSITDNYEFSVVRWFTHVTDEEGVTKKYIIELANNRTLPVRVIELKHDYWPLVMRKFSPIAHDWEGVSIPDLTEDKQRFKAVILNDMGDIVKAEVKPMYLFDEGAFRKTQDFSIRWGKWIPIKAGTDPRAAATPLQTRQISPTVQYVLNYLEQSAQKASASPEIAQGMPGPAQQGKGQAQIQVQSLQTNHSLTAQIFGWSEREFWRHWYYVYADNFDSSLGEKIARLMGPFGTQWIPIKHDDIISGNTLGPSIKIESKQFGRAKKMEEFQMLQGYVQTVVADPTVNVDKTYIYRKMGRLIVKKQEVERMLPLSVDEYQALEENKKLSEGEEQRVTIEQNHQVHLRVHDAAQDNAQTRMHIKLHIHMLMQKRMYPGSFPQLPGETAPGMQGANGSVATPGTPLTPATPQLMNPAQKVKPPIEGVAQ